jgi:hypothetical protein
MEWHVTTRGSRPWQLTAAALRHGQVYLYLLDINELKKYAGTRVTRPFTEDECDRYFPQQTCPSAR